MTRMPHNMAMNLTVACGARRVTAKPLDRHDQTLAGRNAPQEATMKHILWCRASPTFLALPAPGSRCTPQTSRPSLREEGRLWLKYRKTYAVRGQQ